SRTEPGELAASKWNKVVQTAKYSFSAERADLLSAETGFFGLASGILAVAGLLWCAATLRRNPARMLCVFLPVAAIGLSALLTPIMQRYRTFIIIPFMLLALGMMLEDLARRLPDRRWQWALPLLIAALSISEYQRLYREGISNESVRDGFRD